MDTLSLCNRSQCFCLCMPTRRLCVWEENFIPVECVFRKSIFGVVFGSVQFSSVENNEKKFKNKERKSQLAHTHVFTSILTRFVNMLIQGTHHAFPFSVERARNTFLVADLHVLFMYTGKKAITIYKWVPYTTHIVWTCCCYYCCWWKKKKQNCRYDAIGAINKMRRQFFFSSLVAFVSFSCHTLSLFFRSSVCLAVVLLRFSLRIEVCVSCYEFWVLLRGREKKTCVSSDNF